MVVSRTLVLLLDEGFVRHCYPSDLTLFLFEYMCMHMVIYALWEFMFGWYRM